MNPAKARTSTAAALRDGERRFARRGVWLMLLLGLISACGPAMAGSLGVGQAALFGSATFSVVFLGMLAGEQVQEQLAEKVQGLLRLAGLHDSAIQLVEVDQPRAAAIRRPRPAPVPHIRGRALAALTLSPKLLPRPASARALARS